MLECGAEDPNVSLLSELGSRVPRFGTNTVLGGSSPIQNTTVSGIVPNTPPRLNMSDASGTSSVSTGPSNVQGATATASNTSVVGTIINAPSPRQNTQSTEMHQLQQTLHDSAKQQVRMHSPTQDRGDSMSVCSAQGTNIAPTIVETVQEGGSKDSLEEYQDSMEAANLGDEVRVDLHNNANSGCDSGLRDLVVNTDDPGQANFVLSFGALGNASSTPLDGSHDMSFGESTVDEEYTVDREDTALIMAAYNIPSTYNQNDPNVDDSAIVDQEMIGELMSRRSVVDPRPPTLTVQFNEQVAVQHYVIRSLASTSGTNATVSAGNTVGAEPSDSTQSDPVSTQGGPPPSQGGPPPSQPVGDANAGNSPSSTGSNGNGGNQGGVNSGNGPQGPTPNRNYLDKLVFVYSTVGGPLQH